MMYKCIRVRLYDYKNVWDYHYVGFLCADSKIIEKSTN